MPRLQVIVAAVCFGTTGTAQALAPTIEPTAVGSARIVVGALLLALVALVMRRRTGGLSGRAVRGRSARAPARVSGDRSRRSRVERVPSGARSARGLLAGGRGILLVGGVCVAAYQLTFFAAVAETGVAVGTVVAIGSAPAFTGLFDRISGGNRLGGRWAAATVLACAGVALLMLGGGTGAEIAPGGVALAALAGAGYAAYAVASKRLLEAGRAPESVMAGVFGIGALLVAPVLLLVPSGPLLSGGGLALALYLGVVPTALAYVLFARGLRRIPAAETATLTLAEPLTAALLGVVALGERPGSLALVGAALVLSGLLLIAARPARGTPATALRPAEAGAR